MSVRRGLTALGALGALACGGPPLVLAPAPALSELALRPFDTTLFLIGDAGGPLGVRDRVLVELIRQGREAPRGSAIFFLGDNVYPRGIPDSTHPTAADAKARLLAQASVADSTGLAVYFIPGNHDWAFQGPDGWAAIQRAGLVLEEAARAGSPVAQLPRHGCPGPEVVKVGGVARVVLLDTQWWLHRHDRPGRSPDSVRARLPVPDVECHPSTEAGVIDSLTRIFRGSGARIDLLLAHHPFISHAEHGGWHPPIQYLLPVVPTPIAPWLWLPLGWIHPAIRRLVNHPQDQTSRVSRDMRRQIEGTFSPSRPFIFAAGHDHALEVIRHGPGRYYLVSGSGQEDHQSAVGRGDSTAFSSARPGFMRVDVVAGGDSVRLGVTVIDRSNLAQEAYQAWLRP